MNALYPSEDNIGANEFWDETDSGTEDCFFAVHVGKSEKKVGLWFHEFVRPGFVMTLDTYEAGNEEANPFKAIEPHEILTSWQS